MVISRNVVFREDKVYKEIKDQYGNQEDAVSVSQIISLKPIEDGIEEE